MHSAIVRGLLFEFVIYGARKEDEEDHSFFPGLVLSSTRTSFPTRRNQPDLALHPL